MDFYMGVEGEESESETKFNHLVSATELILASNSLIRVPSVKNMPRLQTLQLVSNKITMLASGDLLGATSLVYFGIGNNLIVSVAPEVFANLASFNVTPEAFNPTNADETPVKPTDGIGACPLQPFCTQPLPFVCNIVATVTDRYDAAKCYSQASIYFVLLNAG